MHRTLVSGRILLLTGSWARSRVPLLLDCARITDARLLLLLLGLLSGSRILLMLSTGDTRLLLLRLLSDSRILLLRLLGGTRILLMLLRLLAGCRVWPLPSSC